MKFNPFDRTMPNPFSVRTMSMIMVPAKVVGRDQEHIKLELVDNKSNNVMNGIAFRAKVPT